MTNNQLTNANTNKDMTYNFSPEELKELRECFDLFDSDNSGAIDSVEVKSVLKSIEINTSEEQVNEIFSRLDVNKTGMIEWDEFLELMSKEFNRKFSKRQVQACFKRYDLNSDGIVSINEIRIVMEKIGKVMTQKQLEDMVRKVDKDENGNLNIEEFEKLLP